MCKIFLILLITVFTLTAWEKTDKKDVNLEKDLHSRLPKTFGLLQLTEVKSNQNNMDVFMLLNPLILSKQSNPSFIETYKKMLPFAISGIFCNGKIVNPALRKFINDKNNINLTIIDSSKEKISNLTINPDFCKTNGQENFDITSKINKQLEQGYYDDEFLQKFYVPLMNKDIPNEFSPNFTITKVTSSTGSNLHIYISYKPDDKLSIHQATYKLDEMLQNIYSAACRNEASKRDIAMFHEFTWHGIINEKEVTKLTASKDCR